MTATLNTELTLLLNQEGVEIIKFLDITRLPASLTKGYPAAILLGMPLSAGYLEKVLNTPGYVQDMKRSNRTHEDEFHNIELKTDCLSDLISDFLEAKGYKAYSQSEKNLLATGGYDTEAQVTPLPHKTIALIAGMGWIGKNDLLVTSDFGCAISMCTILTNAPLQEDPHLKGSGDCGRCTVCADECPAGAIKNKTWSPGVQRDEMVDVETCTTCLLCMVKCPWTLKYIRRTER